MKDDSGRVVDLPKLMARVRRMARAMARRLPPSVQVDDLTGAGYLGLAIALARFAGEPEAFDAYALVHARGAMLDELRRGDPMSRSGRARARRADRIARALTSALGRAPEEPEVAEAMGMGLDDYRTLVWQVDRAPTESLADSSDDAGPAVDAAEDTPGAEELLDQRRVYRLLTTKVADLPRREAEVLSLSYDQEETLERIAAILGVSVSRAHQIRGSALRKLRAAFVANDVTGAVA